MPMPLALQPETPEAAIRLAELLLSFSFLIQLPFAALLMGGTAVGLVLGGLGRRGSGNDLLTLAQRTSRLALPDRRMLLLPVAAAVSLAGIQLLYGPRIFSLVFWLVVLGALSAGICLVDLFQRRLDRRTGPFGIGTLAGGAGLVLCCASYALLLMGGALLQRPERWPLLDSQPLLLLTWSGAARFGILVVLGLLLTAAAWCSRAHPVFEGESVSRGRSAGRWLGLAALLLLAPLLLLDLINLPAVAGSLPLFFCYALMVAVAGTGGFLFAFSTPPKTAHGAVPTILLLLLLVAADHLGRTQMLTPQTLWAPEGWLEKGRAPAATEGGAEEDGGVVEAGREVFEAVCSSCHAFDRVRVGPPLNDVVPGYRGDLEKLKAYIRNPVDRNPDYPTMPKLDLGENELDAVARYLLRQAGN